MELKDKRFHFTWIDISQFPLFNEDIESIGTPASVKEAKAIIAKSDAVLFGVP